MRRLALFAFVLLFAACGLHSEEKNSTDHAVVLIYHHVGTETPASTSVSSETFQKHLDYLGDHGYTVWPLSRILDHVQNGDPVPDHTVALTFDDAYRSVYTEVLPRMRRRGWPFTIFVSTDYIDRGYRDYMSWNQLREAARHGAEIDNHTRSHPHLVRRREDEKRGAWLARVRDEINGAQRRLEGELGETSRLFAYPYGEYTADIAEIVRKLGFFGIAQHSGALGPNTDLSAVPRFPMASGYADIEKFATRIRSRPLPVTVLDISPMILQNGARPNLRMRIGDGEFRRSAVACYTSGQGRAALRWEEAEPQVVSVQPEKPLRAGRNKINCTAPASDEAGAYYWYAAMWMVKKADGAWYGE